MLARLKPVLPALWHGHHLALRSGLCVAAAALLTFIFYQHYDLQFGYWGVVSVAAVMQRSFLLTLIKARARIIGTALGVLWSAVIVCWLHYWPEARLLLFFLGLFVLSLLIFAKPSWSYIGIVTGITFVFVLSVCHADPHLWYAVSLSRSIDIAMGVLSLCVCYAVFFCRERLRRAEKPEKVSMQWRYKAALLMAAAATLSLLPWYFWQYEGGVWAPITCLLILEESFDKTMKKAWLRLFAHAVVVCFAGGLSFFCDTTLGTAVVLVLAMFFFGYWLEKPFWGFDSSLANTMAIAFCVILLNAPGPSGIWHSSMARMLNTLLGIACGIAIVKIIQHYVPRVIKPLHARLHKTR